MSFDTIYPIFNPTLPPPPKKNSLFGGVVGTGEESLALHYENKAQHY